MEAAQKTHGGRRFPTFVIYDTNTGYFSWIDPNPTQLRFIAFKMLLLQKIIHFKKNFLCSF